MKNNRIAVVVPAYNRPKELAELMESVIAQTTQPHEFIVVEDKSPMREQLKEVFLKLKGRLEDLGCVCRFVENEANLGFDKNVRKCLTIPKSEWALLLGNDDLLLPNAVEEFSKFVGNHSPMVVSRAFLRFTDDVAVPLGVSKIADHDMIFRAGTDSSKFIFRTGAFIGGLLFNVEFCKRIETTIYDGSLYYQIYIFSEAFCTTGIGYISTPVAAGRAGNPPMFGESNTESEVHVPGTYTAAGRAKMWASVLRIVADAELKYGVQLSSAIRNELGVRQSFHIFEMNVGSGQKNNLQLAKELYKLGLFKHFLPISLFSLNYIFGKKAKNFYYYARKLLQS